MTRYQRGWSYGHSPNIDYTINLLSEQSKGLVFWCPSIRKPSPVDLSRITGAPSFGAEGRPAFQVDAEQGHRRYFDADGANDNRIRFPKSSSWSGLNEITVSVWCYWTATNASWFSGIVTQSDTDANRSWRIRVEGAEPALVWETTDDGAEPDDDHCIWDATGLTLGNWYHIVGTYRDQEMRLYLNGVEIANFLTAHAAPIDDGPSGLTIGGHWNEYGSESALHGGVADVRVYNRCMKPAEIFKLYDNPWELYRPVIPQVLGRSPLTIGEVTWGHDTGVIEANIRDFVGNWAGTGAISGAGDAETLDLETTENMVSEVVNTGAYTVTLYQNLYDGTGDDVDQDYRHGATQAACEAAGWNNYTVPFVSLGFVQIRMTSTL